MEFVLNDEAVKTSHGFYLKNSGGDFTRFDTNPVMLFAHDDKEVIGRWENRAIRGTQLVATAVFDEEDERAAAIKGKVERGFLKGASLGIYIREAEYLPGPTETALVVTKWVWLEGSVVAIPSNAGALSLHVYDEKNEEVTADRMTDYLNGVVKLTAKRKSKNDMEKMELTAEAYTALGTSKEADAAAISQAVTTLAAEKTRLENELTTLRATVAQEQESRAAELVDRAIDEGRLAATEREAVLAFAKTDFAAATRMLAALPDKATLGDKVQKSGPAGDREGWTYFDWKKNAPVELSRLKAEAPEEYAKIVKKLK